MSFCSSYGCSTCSSNYANGCRWVSNGINGYCTYNPSDFSSTWSCTDKDSMSQSSDNSGTIFLSVHIGLFVLSFIVGLFIWRKESKKEGHDINEISSDPMNMAFDKRFKKSQETDCLRNIVSKIYYYSRKGIFNLFSFLLGIIFAIIWGYINGFFEFFVVWIVMTWIDVVKRIYLPAAELFGDILNAIYGQCLRNVKTQPAIFNFTKDNNITNIQYKKLDDGDNNNNNNEIDQFGLGFVVAFPKSDEIDCLRKTERIVYDIFRIGCYNVLVGTIGIILSLLWGLIYGLLQFILTWIIYPVLKLYKLFAIPSAKLMGSIMNAIFGKCLRNVRSEPFSFNPGNNNNNNDDDQKDIEAAMMTGGATNGNQTNGPQFSQIPSDGDAVNNNNNNNNDNDNASAPPGDGYQGNAYPQVGMGIQAPPQTNDRVYS